MSPLFDDEFDLNRIIIKPLYFGMAVNVLIPMGLLVVCYYFDRQQTLSNRIPEMAETLFWVLGGVSVAQAGVALWLRNKVMHQPMIRRKETFEDYLIDFMSSKSKSIFLIIAGIVLYGILYFYLTAQFEPLLFFVIFSFFAFQVVRPRFGFLRKVIARQKELVEQGSFRRD
ncbi:MAG: hypothetical protein JSV52_03145 [Candidatus Zixiibacteriota bacterium]|nr:MAG: hypothetical protein JSV52_03145 [candidate division Zixibacteria bacterium]